MQEIALLNRWMQKGLELQPGEAIFLPCINRTDQQEKYRYLLHERRGLKDVDPERIEALRIYSTYKDHRHWVVLEKLSATPFIGFKKSPGKGVERIMLDVSDERERQLRLMLEDGLGLEEIEDALDELSVEEVEIITDWRK